MNHSSPKPGNFNHGVKFDALIVPAVNIDDAHFDATLFDQQIPTFEINPDLPARQLQPQPPDPDDTAVSFELIPDFTNDRSQRHFEVAPLPDRTGPVEDEFHIPVNIPAKPAPAVAATNNHSTTHHNVVPVAPQIATPAAPARREPAGTTNVERTTTTEASHEYGTTSLPARTVATSATGADVLQTHHQIPGEHGSSTTTLTRQPRPLYHFSPGVATNAPPPESSNSEALNSAITNIIHATPLLTEDELLTYLNDPRNGGFTISLKTLKQALVRIGLETDYKRYRAYITG